MKWGFPVVVRVVERLKDPSGRLDGDELKEV